jgi:hypothetical protein
MRKVSLFVLLLIPFIEGCSLDVDGLQSPPIETVNSIQWSSDGSMLVAFRTKPYDSANGWYSHNYVDVYNRSGTLVSSTAISAPDAPFAITDDAQYFIFLDFEHDKYSLKFGTLTGSVLAPVGAQGDSSLALEWSASMNAISPSGHLMISSKSNGSGLDGAPVTYYLTYFNEGTFREMRNWNSHWVGSYYGATIFNDSLFSICENIGGSDFFSVYDTSLNLIYRESMSPQGTRGIGYARSLNSIVAARNWNGPNGTVNMINLASGKSEQVLLWPGTGMNAAPDGYHVVYPYVGVVVRNLTTNNQKVISSDYSVLQLFSPDTQIVAYVPLSNEAIVKCVAVNGLP